MNHLRFALVGMLALLATLSISLQASADLIHHYKFDETTGTTAFDSGTIPVDGTLAANTGTPVTPFTFDANAVPGKVGGALNFEGAESDVVTLPNGTFTFGTSDFTVAMWIKRSQVGTGTEGLWHQSSSASGDAGSTWSRIDGGGDDLRFTVDRGATGSPIIVADLLTDTEWTHLAIVRRGIDLEMSVNGAVVGTNTLPVNYNINGSTESGIGRYIAGNALTFNGAIDDFRVYDTALNQSEIQALVAEPSSICLVGLAVAGLAIVRRARKP